MRHRELLVLALLAPALAGCRSLLDREAFGRALVGDREAAAKVGADAEPKLSVKPGERYYVGSGRSGSRQVHMYSQQRDTTSVIDGAALRKHARVVVIASYAGPPPPPKGWINKY